METEYSNGLKPKRDNKTKIIIIMSVVIAILLGVITAFLLITSSGNDKQQSKDQEKENQKTEQYEESAKTDLERIQKHGKIIVGITEYPPMNYKENNEWTGFDTELTQAFAKRIGVEVEFIVLADWGTKFTELKAGSIDCVWNGMVITDEALKNASVSDSYAQSSQVAVLPADKAAQVKTIEDLKAFTFAVEEGSAGQAVADENGLKSIAVKDMAAALLEATSGACDGCIIDLTMANATVGKGNYANLATISSLPLNTEEFGVAFRKDSDLTAEFNSFLEDYRANGELAKLAEKYNVEIK